MSIECQDLYFIIRQVMIKVWLLVNRYNVSLVDYIWIEMFWKCSL